MTILKTLSVAEVAERWKQQYYVRVNYGHGPLTWKTCWKSASDRTEISAEEIYNRILGCDSPEQVEVFLSGWVNPFCCECMDYKPLAIRFADQDDDQRPVCLDCLRKAHEELFRAAHEQLK